MLAYHMVTPDPGLSVSAVPRHVPWCVSVHNLPAMAHVLMRQCVHVYRTRGAGLCYETQCPWHLAAGFCGT
jgi:hypothetical protein